MADDVDMLDPAYEFQRKARIEDARRVANSIPAGEPGVCRHCDEDVPRLVGGLCAPCRGAFDRFRRGD